MRIEIAELGDGIRKVALFGKLDVEGTSAIDLRLTALAATAKTYTIVDMAGVEFLSSLGIGSLVKIAVAAQNRGGRLVLMNPQPNVSKVLEVTRINRVIAVVQGMDAALEALKQPLPSRAASA